MKIAREQEQKIKEIILKEQYLTVDNQQAVKDILDYIFVSDNISKNTLQGLLAEEQISIKEIRLANQIYNIIYNISETSDNQQKAPKQIIVKNETVKASFKLVEEEHFTDEMFAIFGKVTDYYTDIEFLAIDIITKHIDSINSKDDIIALFDASYKISKEVYEDKRDNRYTRSEYKGEIPNLAPAYNLRNNILNDLKREAEKDKKLLEIVTNHIDDYYNYIINLKKFYKNIDNDFIKVVFDFFISHNIHNIFPYIHEQYFIFDIERFTDDMYFRFVHSLQSPWEKFIKNNNVKINIKG